MLTAQMVNGSIEERKPSFWMTTQSPMMAGAGAGVSVPGTDIAPG